MILAAQDGRWVAKGQRSFGVRSPFAQIVQTFGAQAVL